MKLYLRFKISVSVLVFLYQLNLFASTKIVNNPSFYTPSSIDTSIRSLNNTVSCGINSTVTLEAGKANAYKWYRNDSLINGAKDRRFTAVISGSYKVVVSDENGFKDSSRSIDIYIVPYPKSSFTINKAEQCILGNEFIFTNTSKIDSGDLSSLWYFGDSKFVTTQNSSHSYNLAGDYVVSLISTSEYGCRDTAKMNVATLISPKVEFEVNSSNQCVNNNLFKFTNKTISTISNIEYKWFFGDGGTVNSSDATYKYTESSNFNVKLIAFNRSCSDSASM